MTGQSNATVEAFWRRCKEEHDITANRYYAGPFSDPRMAPYQDMLLDLVTAAKKRATARLEMEFERLGIERRAPGDYWLVLSAEGEPRFLILITDVDVRPFDEVEESFAAREGEGDGSLDYWRQVHRDYFVQQCAQWSVEWRENLATCCEGFDLVASA